MTGHRWRYGWDYPMEASLVVAVHEATPHVGPVRDRFDPYSRIGVPPHITALYPFFDAESLTDDLEERVTDALTKVAPFEFELARVAAFDSAIYLAPEPAEPLIALTKTLWDRFPECPPFGGQFDTIIPHMTVGWADDGASAELVTELLGDHLPISATAREVTLLAEEFDGWVTRRVFPLR